MGRILGFVIAVVWLAGCSSTPPEMNKAATPASSAASSAAPNTNSVAKYLELAGFRLDEKGPGKVQIRFALINHSDADLGDITLSVNVRASTAASGDPPLFTFTAPVQGVGPGDVKDVSVIVPTKLRVYELPDWQFLRADFQVTSPQ
jgi:hypothetical protein